MPKPGYFLLKLEAFLYTGNLITNGFQFKCLEQIRTQILTWCDMFAL